MKKTLLMLALALALPLSALAGKPYSTCQTRTETLYGNVYLWASFCDLRPDRIFKSEISYDGKKWQPYTYFSTEGFPDNALYTFPVFLGAESPDPLPVPQVRVVDWTHRHL